MHRTETSKKGLGFKIFLRLLLPFILSKIKAEINSINTKHKLKKLFYYWLDKAKNYTNKFCRSKYIFFLWMIFMNSESGTNNKCLKK